MSFFRSWTITTENKERDAGYEDTESCRDYSRRQRAMGEEQGDAQNLRSYDRGKKCGKAPCAKAEKLFFSPPSPGKKQESNPAWMNIHREMKDFAPHDGKTRPFIPRFSRTQSLMPPWVAGFSTVCTCPTTTTKNNISCHAVSERMIPCCFP